MISPSMELWERIVEAMLRGEQQYGFIPGKSTRDAKVALRMFEGEVEKVRRSCIVSLLI